MHRHQFLTPILQSKLLFAVKVITVFIMAILSVLSINHQLLLIPFIPTLFQILKFIIFHYSKQRIFFPSSNINNLPTLPGSKPHGLNRNSEDFFDVILKNISKICKCYLIQYFDHNSMGTCVSTCTFENNPQVNNQDMSVNALQTNEIKPQLQEQHPTQPQEHLPQVQTKVEILPTKKPFKKSRFYQQQESEWKDYCVLQPQNNGKIYSKTFIVPKKNKRHSSKKRYQNDWVDETTSNITKSIREIKRNRNKLNNFSNNQVQPFLIIGQKTPISISTQCKDPFHTQLVSTTKDKNVVVLINHDIGYEDGSFYKGQWRNQQKQGKGTYCWPDGTKYQGQWLKDSIEGMGKVSYANGDVYEGEFKSNCAQGFGQFRSKDGLIYKGTWKSGFQEGQGELTFQNGDKYKGNWKAGKKNGYGQLSFKDGSYYKGEFNDNQIQGQGEYNWEGKKRYKGTWEHNQMHGKGKMEWSNGQQYQGYFSRGKMHGKGYFYDINGSIFSGTWEQGRRNGIFTQTTPNGQITKGLWGFNKLIRPIESTQVTIDEQDISICDSQATI